MAEIDIEELVEEVCQPRGCRVSHVEDKDALEFIKKVSQMKRTGKNPNLGRASEILEEKWGVHIPRRSLSEHARGKCSCQKRR